MLTKDQIINKLCYYDARRETVKDCYKSEGERPKNCSCDNCFYWRHELASQLLNSMDELAETEKELSWFQKQPY